MVIVDDPIARHGRPTDGDGGRQREAGTRGRARGKVGRGTVRRPIERIEEGIRDYALLTRTKVIAVQKGGLISGLGDLDEIGRVQYVRGPTISDRVSPALLLTRTEAITIGTGLGTCRGRG